MHALANEPTHVAFMDYFWATSFHDTEPHFIYLFPNFERMCSLFLSLSCCCFLFFLLFLVVVVSECIHLIISPSCISVVWWCGGGGEGLVFCWHVCARGCVCVVVVVWMNLLVIFFSAPWIVLDFNVCVCVCLSIATISLQTTGEGQTFWARSRLHILNGTTEVRTRHHHTTTCPHIC